MSKHVIAIWTVATALTISLAGRDLLGIKVPYFFFASAVVVSAYKGTVVTGLLATLLSILTCTYFILRPVFSFEIRDPSEMVLLLLFALEGVVLSILVSLLGSLQRKALHSILARYTAMLAAIAIAFAIKVWVHAPAERELPFILFYSTIMFSVWYGGQEPGFVATGLTAAIAAFYFYEPRFSFRVADPDQVIRLLVFLLEGTIITLVATTFFSARERAAQMEEAARIAQEALKAREIRLRKQNRVLLELAGKKPPDTTDPHIALQWLTEASARTLDCARVSVWVFDDSHLRMQCVDLFERSTGQHTQGAELLAADYPGYFEALKQDRVLAAHDALTDPRTISLAEPYLRPLKISGLLDAPIRRQGQMVGVVCHEHMGDARQWSIEDEHFAGSIADLTALVLDTCQLKQLESQLVRTQRLEAIGSLTSGIAHDLNNVLSPLVMGLELLSMPLAEGKRTSMLETLGKSVERARAMVQQILAFVRGEGKRERLVVGPIITELTRFFEHTFPHNITVEASVPTDLSPIWGDHTQLYQILLNLCVNARDAMPQGGTLSIVANNTTLAPGDLPGKENIPVGRAVRLDVRDTGSGIPVAIREKIFDPFFTTKAPEKGTGLGLSTTRRLIEQMGGALTLTSEIGKGTTFTVYLPDAESVERPPVVAEIGPATGKGELILVIDDEASIRELARRTLEADGYRVLVAQNEKEIYRHMLDPQTKPSCVLLNVMLPGSTPSQLFDTVKRLIPGVPIVASTSISAMNAPTTAPKLGEVAFLPKPYTASALLAVVHQVLQSR
jgi:signal transduction histidine kinase